MTREESHKVVLLENSSIEYKLVSINYLPSYFNALALPKWQVFTEASRFRDKKTGLPFSELYDNIDMAIVRYLEIKDELYAPRPNKGV